MSCHNRNLMHGDLRTKQQELNIASMVQSGVLNCGQQDKVRFAKLKHAFTVMHALLQHALPWAAAKSLRKKCDKLFKHALPWAVAKSLRKKCDKLFKTLLA